MFVRNQIGFIKDSNWKTQNEEEIADYLSSKFNKLFTSSYPTFSPDLDNLFVLCIIEEENLGLSMNPDEELCLGASSTEKSHMAFQEFSIDDIG